MSGFMRQLAAVSGSTGNNTHTSIRLSSPARGLGLALVVETGGATPTISWKVQGTFANDDVSDANATWFDALLLPAASDTVAAVPLVIPSPNAVTGFVSAVYIAQGNIRFLPRIRVVTTANTNVTYRVEIVQQYMS